MQSRRFLSLSVLAAACLLGGAGAAGAQVAGGTPVSSTAPAAGLNCDPAYTGGPEDNVFVGTPGPDRMCGGEGDDVLIGRGGADFLFGQGGSDAVWPGEGNDAVLGGTEVDRVVYRDVNGPITLDLGAKTSTGSGSDSVASIEQAIGSPGADSLTGTPGPNALSGLEGADSLLGLGGNDVLVPGLGSDPVVSGGDDRDVVSYGSVPGPVGIDLAAGTSTGTGSDTLSGIEDAVGSPAGDTLAGDSGPNRLVGLDGGDSLFGRVGQDTLFPGMGNDLTVSGGAGGDRVSYSGIAGPVVVDLGAGTASGAWWGEGRASKIRGR